MYIRTSYLSALLTYVHKYIHKVCTFNFMYVRHNPSPPPAHVVHSCPFAPQLQPLNGNPRIYLTYLNDLTDLTDLPTYHFNPPFKS